LADAFYRVFGRVFPTHLKTHKDLCMLFGRPGYDGLAQVFSRKHVGLEWIGDAPPWSRFARVSGIAGLATQQRGRSATQTPLVPLVPNRGSCQYRKTGRVLGVLSSFTKTTRYNTHRDIPQHCRRTRPKGDPRVRGRTNACVPSSLCDPRFCFDPFACTKRSVYLNVGLSFDRSSSGRSINRSKRFHEISSTYRSSPWSQRFANLALSTVVPTVQVLPTTNISIKCLANQESIPGFKKEYYYTKSWCRSRTRRCS
jgi:hypothetical protein